MLNLIQDEYHAQSRSTCSCPYLQGKRQFKENDNSMFGDKDAYMAKFETCARTRTFESRILGREFFQR